MPVPLKDKLDRRFRHAPPQPTGKRVRPRDRGLKWFEMLHRHGPLPTSFLHEFTKARYPSLDGARDALKDFYNENSWLNRKEGNPYLFRPPEQRATPDANINEYVYDITTKGEKALQQQGLYRQSAVLPSHHQWDHDFMISCITSSIHLGTLGTDREFMFHDEIYDRIGTFQFPLQFIYRDTLIKKVLRPDRSIGIRFPNGEERIYLIEADCGTESYQDRQAKFTRKTQELNIQMYLEFIAKGGYKKYFGNIGIRVLFVLSMEYRMQETMKLVDEMSRGKGSSFLLYKPWSTFASNDFKPPKPRPDLFTDFWYRSVHPPRLISEI